MQASSNRIFILGTHPSGAAIAKCLKDIKQPPKINFIYGFDSNSSGLPKKFDICSPPTYRLGSSNSSFNSTQIVAQSFKSFLHTKNEKIQNLIITNYDTNIFKAIRQLKSKFAPNITILLLSEGLGLANDIYFKSINRHNQNRYQFLDNLFDDLNIIIGEFTHTFKTVLNNSNDNTNKNNIKKNNKIKYNKIEHLSYGSLLLSINKSHPTLNNYENTPLVQLLSNSLQLNTNIIPWPELYVIKLQSLIVNSALITLSLAAKCSFKEVYLNKHLRQIAILLMNESINVSLSSPIAQQASNYHLLLNKESILEKFKADSMSISNNNSFLFMQNKSYIKSFLIYLNGYIIRLALKLRLDGINTGSTRNNLFMLNLVTKYSLKEESFNRSKKNSKNIFFNDFWTCFNPARPYITQKASELVEAAEIISNNLSNVSSSFNNTMPNYDELNYHLTNESSSKKKSGAGFLDVAFSDFQ